MSNLFPGPRMALYENKTAEIKFGSRRIQMCLEHAVTSSAFMGMTHYNHYYNASVEIESNPCQPAIDSPESLPAICGNHQENMEVKIISEARVARFPNKSKAWIDGARIYLHYAGLLEAKEFIKKGIKMMKSRNFKERQEKLNLWKALIQMEAEFGNQEDLLTAFEEGLKHNKKRDLCLQLLHWMIQYKESESRRFGCDECACIFHTRTQLKTHKRKEHCAARKRAVPLPRYDLPGPSGLQQLDLPGPSGLQQLENAMWRNENQYLKEEVQDLKRQRAGLKKELKFLKECILKKFKTQKEVYMVLFEYYLKQGAINDGRALLQKSLKYVPPKGHPDVLEKFASLEQKYLA